MRGRQIKNFLLTLAISRGVPMLLGGDEFRRTQRGNNNAYCQDNDRSWLDWTLLQRHEEIWRFARSVLALRHAHAVLTRMAFYTDDEIQWFGPRGTSPDWHDGRQKCLACLIHGELGDGDLYLMFNADTTAMPFALPPARGGAWHLAIDTAQAPPHDCWRPPPSNRCGSRTITSSSPAPAWCSSVAPELVVYLGQQLGGLHCSSPD